VALTPTQFADRWMAQILEPAVTSLAGTDGKFSRTEARRWSSRLEGISRHAGDNFGDIFDRVDVRLPRLPMFLEAARAYAESKAREAAGADGNVQSDRLDPKLQADLAALDAPSPERPYTFSERIITSVMEEFSLGDRSALLEEAKRHDNGNRRLTRAELTAAARALTANPSPSGEVGIVSDLDKTIVPPEGPNGALPPSAYAGVATLMRELELGQNGTSGDMYYVTARLPARVTGVPAWLEDHGLPGGPISTGVSTVPGAAQREKVKDISEIMNANPNQSFVMFGDTAHRDPEVYREVQTRFGARVRAVFIHKVDDTVPAARVRGMILIDNYAEAAAHLFGLGVFTERQARTVMNDARSEGLAITPADIEALIEAHRPN
jgi:hypothetical protein